MPSDRGLDPSVGLAEFRSRPIEPNIEPIEPNIEPIEPNIEPIEPISELVEPIFEPTEPNIEPVEPIFEPTEPNIELVEPIFEPTEPNIELVEPIYKPTEPVFEAAGSRRQLGQIAGHKANRCFEPGVGLAAGLGFLSKGILESREPLFDTGKPAADKGGQRYRYGDRGQRNAHPLRAHDH